MRGGTPGVIDCGQASIVGRTGNRHGVQLGGACDRKCR
jgi:hypothetical protein